MSYRTLDDQLRHFSGRLKDDVNLKEAEVGKVATCIAAEVRFMDPTLKDEVRAATPVPLQARLEELKAFQDFMQGANSVHGNPSLTRAQVIVQNYVCFAYLGESCFRVLRKHAPSSSVTKRCCAFLTDNPVRAFRNAIAHANWKYRDDYHALIYWARKGADPQEPLVEFEVVQEELQFWQMLSRGVAYAAYTSL